jgi:molybdopterin converting factor small subunit
MSRLMKVTLRLLGTLSKIASPEQEVCLPENASVISLLDSLTKQYGVEFGKRIKLLEMWQISINGNLHILSAVTESKLKDQDELIILPISFGG